MYVNVAYLDNQYTGSAEDDRPLSITSCGYYRISGVPEFSTDRPNGRVDYQLLYVAAGKAHFYFDGEEHTVLEGNMVLYRPNEPQKYFYYSSEKPEIYWVHFTGSEVERILEENSMSCGKHLFFTGASSDYKWIFEQMISELQLCRPNFCELLSLLLNHIFLKIDRYSKRESERAEKLVSVHNEIEFALGYFNHHYRKDISIKEYAASRHMSTCWFIRSFKEILKITPMQYILSLRISSAQNLLETTEYNITEVAAAVGYDNPLYFSRLFKKTLGVSPSEYRASSRGRK